MGIFLNSAKLFFNRKFFLRLFCYLVFSFLFLVLFKFAFRSSFFVGIDSYFEDLAISLRTPSLNAFFISFTNFGGEYIVLPMAFILAVYFFWKKRYGFDAAIIASGVIALISIESMKAIFHRARPPIENALTHEASFSFPSGHTLATICFYGLLAYFVYYSADKKWERFFALFLGCAIIFFIAFSRIYLGVHWFSDILGSFILGGSWLFLVIRSFNDFKKATGENLPK